ncbi:MAG: YicC family protein [Gammaproteobacteria bacterium]|nr:YicC family protein [Gammaproteobacteria bacterium]MDH5731120.1 YicC family protein [Gammaproteobacteria bacterium]
MIYSMTAFARHDKKITNSSFTWEIRSVNHRYLETTVRVPEEFRALETLVRQQVAAQLKRGKVECILSFKQHDQAEANAKINESVLKNLDQLCQQASHLLIGSHQSSLLDVLRWPGVLEVVTPDLESLSKDILVLLDDTLHDLVETRAREGEKLANALRDRNQSMLEIVVELRSHLPEMLNWVRERLSNRFEELNLQLDQDRLEQEIVLIATKTDVEEELKRLETHIEEVRRILASNETKAVGRRLDFLMQELNREANTLCSKSMDQKTTAAGIDLKVLIEQMREQVQNIE